MTQEQQKVMAYEKVRSEYEFPFELYPYQIATVNELGDSALVWHECGLYHEVGCVDSETEYLTPTGWEKISEYANGPVGQLDPETEIVTFVTPSAYVKEPCTEMIRIKTKYGLDQLLSPEHKVLLYWGDKPERGGSTTSAQALLEDHDRRRKRIRSVAGAGHIPFGHAAIKTTFKVAGGSGIDLTDAQLRLQIAVIADGHFPKKSDMCDVRVKKLRKIERMRYLLDEAGVEYTERAKDYPTAKGFHVFSFHAPLRIKEFDERFWAATAHQINIIAVEATWWDGSLRGLHGGVSFTSVCKASADFIQYVWTVTGRTSRIHEDNRGFEKYTSGKCYNVLRRGGAKATSLLHMENEHGDTIWKEPSTDGFKYCFTVSTGFLVLRRNGCIFTTGNCGKTATVTHWALTKKHVKQWIIVMPPILLYQWDRWLRSIKRKRTGKALTTTIYTGSPQKRKALNLDAEFILMSYGMMKNDFEHLKNKMWDREYGVIADEAHALKNSGSGNHKLFRGLSEAKPRALLTGTPLTTPMDAYAYVKLIAPLVYRNLRQFENVHIEEKDMYGTVTKWRNLELLASNMEIQTSRVLRREVRDQVPKLTYTTMVYDLAPAHQKLYERIAQEKLVEFADGREINAISTQALYSALQQIILNWAHFEEDDSKEPAALDVIDEVFDEIGPTAKLAIVANFIRSNAYLVSKLKKYGVVAVYGEVTASNKQKAIKRFIEDPSCRCILLQPQSAGYGIDGLQDVCSDMLILEAPTVAPPFHQVVARIDREGQRSPVNCRVAVANRTVQVRMFANLLKNDALVNSIQGGYQDLKEAIYGN